MSVSHIFHRQSGHSGDELAIGVIGMNVHASYMETLLMQQVTTCADDNIR